MKQQLILLFTLIITVSASAQITFEPGYFIDNDNKKVECLIKNIDWRSNPTQFEYQLNENSEKKKATIKTVKEFGINNVSKYVRFIVDIDRSSMVVDNLSDNPKPIFNKEELFLLVLIEGKSNLYEYTDFNLKRYFYNYENSTVEQLVYKLYLTSSHSMRKNNHYKQQLLNNLTCSTITSKKIKKLKYSRKYLVRFFVEYNKCTQEDFINFIVKQKKSRFNLNIRPRFYHSSLSIKKNGYPSRDTDFGSRLGVRLGIESEWFLPYYKNKLAIIIEPTYQQFEGEEEIPRGNVKVDYKSLELPVGIRHYFFLNENSKLFVNLSVVFDFSNQSIIEQFGAKMELRTRNNFAFGLGYNYKRFSVELRHQTRRELLNNYTPWETDYITSSAIVGFRLF